MIEFYRLVLYRLCPQLGTALFSVLIATLYPEEIAQNIFLLVLVLYLLSILSRNGLEMVVLKDYCGSSQERPLWLGNIVCVVLSMSIVYGGVYYLIDCLWLDYDNSLWVVLNLFPFSSLIVFSFFLRASGLMFLSAVAEPGSIFLVLSIVIMSTTFLSDVLIDSILVMTITNWVLFLMTCSFLLKFNFLKFEYISLSTIRRQLLLGKPFVILALASYVLIWVPALVMQADSPTSFVDYTLAIRFLAPVTFMLTTADLYLSSRFSRAHQRDDLKAINSLFSSFRYFFLIVGSFYVATTIVFLLYSMSLFVIISEELVFFYSIILIGYLLSSLIGPCGILLSMSGLVDYANYATISTTLLVVLVVMPISAMYGGVGIVVVVAAAIVVKNMINMAFLKHLRALK